MILGKDKKMRLFYKPQLLQFNFKLRLGFLKSVYSPGNLPN